MLKKFKKEKKNKRKKEKKLSRQHDVDAPLWQRGPIVGRSSTIWEEKG